MRQDVGHQELRRPVIQPAQGAADVDGVRVGDHGRDEIVEESEFHHFPHEDGVGSAAVPQYSADRLAPGAGVV
jgi:hypothetical protein